MRVWSLCLLMLIFGNTSVAVADPTASALERSLSPDQIRALVESRVSAENEFRKTDAQVPLGATKKALLDRNEAISVITLKSVQAHGPDKFRLSFIIEQALRGEGAPDADACWRDGAWPKRQPSCAMRSKPVLGKRMLVGFVADGKSVLFTELLDLDNPKESSVLPLVQKALKIDYESERAHGTVSNVATVSTEQDAALKLQLYGSALGDEAALIRDFAFERLLADPDIVAPPALKTSILNATGQLLQSAAADTRLEGIEWLDQLARRTEACHYAPCSILPVNAEDLRPLLTKELSDQNAVTGDEAFRVLSTLDFYKPENGGYCEDIVPALRSVERYSSDDVNGRVIGGQLNASQVCLGKNMLN